MTHTCGNGAGVLCRECEEEELAADLVKAKRHREWQGKCRRCGDPLRADGGCQLCDEDRAKEIPFVTGVLFTILLICFSAVGQTVLSGHGSFTGAGSWAYGSSGGLYTTGENGYCTKGTGTEITQGTPTWGSSDGVAVLPTQCMYTGTDATPSPGSVLTPANSLALTSALSSVTCGQTIQLTAGNVYTGPFTFPALGCDGAHWITVQSSGVSNGYFPTQGTQATPCIAGISNDATNGYNEPGYPSYSCPSYPTVLTAQLTSSTVNQAPIQFASGATHYRFIGIEVTKNPSTIMGGALIMLTSGGTVLGSDHIIFDRSIIHGPPLTVAAQQNISGAGNGDETQAGIFAANSQWIALINSWDFDTYCNQVCSDSNGYHAGTGAYQDGPHKLYDNVISTAGESWMFGGGGVGPGTPVSTGIEIRANLTLKPLLWMIPVNACVDYPDYAQVKNLGELKNGASVIVEGNTAVNSWQGCQENQDGYAFLIDPKNQNDKTAAWVNFDGTDGLVTLNTTGHPACAGNGSNQCFTNQCGGANWCNPCGGSATSQSAAAAAACVPALPVGNGPCPPGGCILYDIGTANQYRFCDGGNGCYQTSDGTSIGTPLDMLTSARVLPLDGVYPPSGSAVAEYTCVPGLDPMAAIHNIVERFNYLNNLTNGIILGTGKAAYCEDETQGMDTGEFHDNLFSGLSIEMTNGTGPYEATTGFVISNGQMGKIINTVEFAHNDVIQEDQQQPIGIGGFGSQQDNTDVQYLQGFNIHDNVGMAPWAVLHSQGSMLGSGGGVGGAGGLSNFYQTDSCQAVYPSDGNPNDLATGIVQNPSGIAAGTSYTFSPPSGMGTNYFVTKNGQYSAITSQASSGFVLTASLASGDSFTVRNLNNCNWTFQGNILGEGLAGSGEVQDPYPSGNAILSGSGFTGIFANWVTRNGTANNYALTSGSGYKNTATDASARQTAGLSKDPGIDTSTFATLTTQSSTYAANIYYYPLSFGSSSLSLTSSGAYQGQLMNLLGSGGVTGGYGASGGGASPYKSFWSNSAVSPSGSGIILGRDGMMDGPFEVQTVSRSVTSCGSAGTVACSSFNPAVSYDANTTPVVGQTIVLSGFINYGSGSSANDSSFNGTCTIQTVASNGTVTCAQTGTGYDTIASHSPVTTPNHGCTVSGDGWYHCSAVTFVPLTAGSPHSYTFSVNAKDGAFQQATTSLAITVN